MTDGARLSYVYGVCRDGALDEPPDLPGVAGTGAYLVSGDALLAVVSTVPETGFDEAALRARLDDLESLELLARAHHAVIEAVAVRAAVLPLRLATVYRDDSRVRTMLREDRRRLTAALDRVEGHAEWGVKIYADVDAEPAPAAPAPAPGPPAERMGSGRDYLRRRRQERTSKEEVWRNAAELTARADSELTAIATDVRVHRPQNRRLSGASGENVLNAAYLVPVARTRDFTTTAEGLAASLDGARLELTGPWAPYSFTAPAPAETAEAAGQNAEAGR